MHTTSHLSYLAAVAILSLSLTALVMPGTTRYESGGLLVVATFPGIEGDLATILCPGDVLESLPPTLDPHSPALRPSFIKLLEKADIVVTMAHTRADQVAESLMGEAGAINVERLAREPPTVSGKAGRHYPIYNPLNYAVLMEKLSLALASARPECRDHYMENARALATRALAVYWALKDSLAGSKAVVSSALIVGSISWLGVDISIVLSAGPEAQTTPGNLLEAEKALSTGAIAVAMVDQNGTPIDRASSWLVSKAKKHGSQLILVETPFSGTPLIEKIEGVALQALMISGNTS
ncbi:MAG: zinc ABC transporter substrate-binding protein [Desulfurococcales archaeon]|nr:zinc ABC transporter substrate-binding protein [Desulfurococcales archaeon]